MNTMTLPRPCVRVYWLLMVLTGVTLAVGELPVSGLSISLAVLGLALFKGFLIGDFFMGLKEIRGIWRWVILLWLVPLGALLALAFVLAWQAPAG